MIEIQNSPPTPPRISHFSPRRLHSPAMSSYHRYSPANPPAHGPPPHSQYPSAQYPYSNEQYRGQPPIPQPPQGPLNLPPLRSIDPRQPQVLQPPISSGPVYGGAPMGGGGYSPMPGQMPPMEAGSQYYPGPVGNPSGPYDPAGYGSNQPMLRYPLAVGDTRRAYPAGRNKKEVKRRTKTGCMTCRKRRIKVSLPMYPHHYEMLDHLRILFREIDPMLLDFSKGGYKRVQAG